MRKILTISLASLISIGCGTAVQPTANTNGTAGNAIVRTTNAGVQPPSDSTIVSSHSTTAANSAVAPSTAAANSAVPPSNKPASSSTESPMARPIDVTSLNAGVQAAEAEYQKNPKSKNDLAKAYFVRATALTDAAQYRAALGDYRKGLKLDPNDEEARKMHDQILSIFKSIGREPPKDGEEPQALPFKKES